jgi:hypothetical protein
MQQQPMNRILMGALVALALGGQPEAALARSNGGGGSLQSGNNQGGGQNGANQGGGPTGGSQGGGQSGNFQGGGQGGGRNGFTHSGSRWRGGDRDRDGRRRRGGYGGYGEGGDGFDESGWGESIFVDPHFEDFADHRFEGLFGWGTGWPDHSLFAPPFYGAGPPCIRRDVYNDVYRSC